MKFLLARILDRLGNWCLRRSMDLAGWPVAAEHVTESCFTLHDIPFHMPADFDMRPGAINRINL